MAVKARVPAGCVLLLLVSTACQSEAAINRNPHVGATTASVGADGIQDVTLTTGDDYRFHPSTVVVHPGKVRITLTNTGKGAPHDFQVTGLPGTYVPLASSGQTKQATFTAPAPGTYTFVCTIHVRQGQTGTLVVLSS